MRRFAASVFPNSKRIDRSDKDPPPPHPRKRSLKRTHPHPPPTISPDSSIPQLAHSDHAQSSASSSSGSTGLHTPDDDVASSKFLSKKSSSWVSWLARKKSNNTLRAKDTWRPSSPPPILHPAPLGRQRPHHPPSTAKPAQDDVDTSEESDVDDSDSSSDQTHTLSKRDTIKLAQCREHAKVITSNKLIPIPSAPPLLRIVGTHLYPRSCNVSRFLPFPETLQSRMQRRRLLAFFNSGPLSPADQDVLVSFKPTQTPMKREKPLSDQDNIVAPDVRRISPFSHGLKRWVTRKPFEERMLSWVPSDDGTGDVTVTHVKGTTFGVPEVEFSEHLELLAGMYAPADDHRPRPEIEWSPPELLSGSEPALSSPSSNGNAPDTPAPNDIRKTPYKANPSPLRTEHQRHGLEPPRVSPPAPVGASSQMAKAVTETEPLSSPSPPPSDTAPARPARRDPPPRPSLSAPKSATLPPPSHKPPPSSSSSPPPVQRGVRFAEDDQSDNIPLGYVVRMKKKRQEKAKFLQEEKERRAFEEERRKVEAERTKREAERLEWEKERKAWEKEKKAAEESRKKRLYVEEVAAARSRRETSRAGHTAGTTTSSNRGDPDSQPSSWDTSRRYQRPVYDSSLSSRKHASDSETRRAPPNSGSSAAGSISSHVPGSSRSVRHSRPPSLYSEDPRGQRRASGGAMSSGSPTPDRASTFSTWSAGHVPPAALMPMAPMFMTDMPLLPPNAPFMLQQYSPRSQNSTANASRRSSGLSNNPSLEKVNQLDSRQMPAQAPQTPGFQQPPAMNAPHVGFGDPLQYGASMGMNSPQGLYLPQPSPLFPGVPSNMTGASSFLTPPNPWLLPRAMSSPVLPVHRNSTLNHGHTVIA